MCSPSRHRAPRYLVAAALLQPAPASERHRAAVNNQAVEAIFDLGSVAAPSGSIVLGMAGWIDYWPATGQPLSRRASAVVATGGGHLRDGECEAVAAPAAGHQPLTVRARTSPSPFDGEPTIAVLEVDLGLPWQAADDAVIVLGDLPVDRCGMVLGDAEALDTFVGLGGDTTDGLADVAYWGKHVEAAHAVFGGEVLGSPGHPRGWLDLPLEEALSREVALNMWRDKHMQGAGLMVSVEEHTDYAQIIRAGWDHPLHCGLIDVAGYPVLGIEWDQGDHAMRHRGERRHGQVYPVTLHRAEHGGTVLRWTIPPYEESRG